LLRELGAGKRDQQRDGEKATDAPPRGAHVSPQGPISAETVDVGGAHDSDKQLDCAPLFKYAHADYELLKQQTKHVALASTKGKQLTLKSLETLLVEMLDAGAHDAAEQPTAFMVDNSCLDKRTARYARKRLFDGKYISAKITKRKKLLNIPKKKERRRQEQEYWSDVRLTDTGVALARYISSLNQPHRMHQREAQEQR